MWALLKLFRLPGKFCICQTSVTRNVHLRPRFIDKNTNIAYGGDLAHPTPNQSIGSVLFNRMVGLDRKERVLQICSESGKEMKTKTFLTNAVALAEGLSAEGAKKGDFVLLVGNNTLNMNVALIGILLLAAIPVPLSSRTESEEFEAILKSMKPKFFCCQKKYLHPFKRVLIDTTDFDPSKIFLLDQETDPMDPETKGFGDFIVGRGLNYEAFHPTEVNDPKTELALAMKSLTDGVPGRVVGVTHHNLNSVLARHEHPEDSAKEHDKVILMVQKVLWLSGIYSLIHACAFGSKLIVMQKFEEEPFLKALSDYKVTDVEMFLSKWWLVYKHAPRRHYDFCCLRSASATDGCVPKVLMDGIKEKLGLSVGSSYGITELSGLVLKTANTGSKEGSVGKLLPQVYGKVVSDIKSENVGPNTEGELCFKGPIVTQGYLNNSKANRELFDKDGFLLTGQYGYYEEDGDFYIIDKIIHQIKYKSHKISPKELEGIIRVADLVKDVCVSGISHSTEGEYPIAFVVLQKGQKLKESDIVDYVNERVPDHKRLRGGVIFVTKIPRVRETGSIRRKTFKKILSKYVYKDNSKNEEAVKSSNN